MCGVGVEASNPRGTRVGEKLTPNRKLEELGAISLHLSAHENSPLGAVRHLPVKIVRFMLRKRVKYFVLSAPRPSVTGSYLRQVDTVVEIKDRTTKTRSFLFIFLQCLRTLVV